MRRRRENPAHKNGMMPTNCAKPQYVAQVFLPAVSQVFKPAGRPSTQRARHFHALPIWKSAIQQVWKPALQSDDRSLAGVNKPQLMRARFSLKSAD
jgi:hypothetical protein